MNSLIYDNGTNVGISSTSPDEKLTVGGRLNATGLCINGNCISSWGAAGSISGSGVAGQPTYWVSANEIGATSTLAIAYGGTGASTAEQARNNLGLRDTYDFGINSTGTVGWLWQSDGDGRGQWIATTSLGIAGAGNESTFIGTTTYMTDGNFASSTLRGYQAANYMCAAEFSGSHFCRTHEILAAIILNNISNWGSDMSNAWIAEGPPGYTYDSNDCNGYTDNTATKLGAFWLFNSDGGGAGWLVNCGQVKSLACCKIQ
jgi:hypothetical protein